MVSMNIFTEYCLLDDYFLEPQKTEGFKVKPTFTKIEWMINARHHTAGAIVYIILKTTPRPRRFNTIPFWKLGLF